MDELDRLFGAPLAEFTAARNELARQLKAAGKSEEADAVRALSKPSVPAWAINQLSRSERKAVKDLLAAGEALRRASERVLRKGGTTDELREAVARQRDAIQQLTGRAQAVLEEAGRPASAATLDRVARTLQAASVDEDGRRLLEAGRLTEELGPAGFEALGGVQLGARTPDTPSPRDEPAEKHRQREEARQRRQELRRKVQELERAARQAERKADRAQAEAAEARRHAENLRAEADEAAAELANL